MLLIDINIKAKDDTNGNFQFYLPASLARQLKLRSHIPFISKKSHKLIQSLLASLKEEAKGLLVEVENKEVIVKVEVIENEAAN